MAIEIKRKIVSQSIKKDNGVVEESVPDFMPADVDPLTLRIESRPEGSLEAVSEKIDYVGAEGRRKVYVIVSFMPVAGVVQGEEVVIERPVEFFFPASQLSSEYQWITATMRSLSLAARGGYITQALQDLRKVAWDKGLVRCGKNKYGKPAFHSSEVAAIAWSIQQILHRRGFLDEDGNQVTVEDLITKHRPAPTVVSISEPEETAVEVDAIEGKSVGNCPECQSKLVLMDGCPTCIEGCGWSKCG